MKNKRTSWFIALIAVIGFIAAGSLALAGCDWLFGEAEQQGTDDPDNPNPNPSDGMIWKYYPDTLPFEASVAYGNGKFVALGQGRTATSTDYKNWTEVTGNPFEGKSIRRFIYAGGKFHVVAELSGPGGYIYSYSTSTDGVNWTPLTESNLQFAPNSIAYGDGTFVALNYGDAGSTRTYRASYSTDGVNWTAVNNPPYAVAVAYGNGRFVTMSGAAGNADGIAKDTSFATSTDGITWTEVDKIVPSYITALAYGNGIFIAGFRNGEITVSTDGETWNNAYQDAFDNIGGIICGNGIFVAHAYGLIISDSSKPLSAAENGGMAWAVSKDSGKVTLSETINDIAYGGGRFVLAHNNDSSAERRNWDLSSYSEDGGVTWALSADRVFPNTTGIKHSNAIAYGDYGGGTFVAGSTFGVGGFNNNTQWGGGDLSISKDGGSTWTVTKENPDRIGSTMVGGSSLKNASINAIAYGNGTFVAVGMGSTLSPAIWYSTDGGNSWASVSGVQFGLFGTAPVDAIAYGNGKFVAGSYDIMACSSDGANWTRVLDATGGLRKINAIAYGGGRFVAVGNGIAYSSDGISWTVADNPFGKDKVISADKEEEISSIAYGNGKFVIGSRVFSGSSSYGEFGGGRIAYSTDGISWTTLKESGFSPTNSINAIAYGDGKFIAVGGRGWITYSTD